MPPITTLAPGLPGAAQKSPNPVGTVGGYFSEIAISELAARYSTLCKAGRLFSAYALVTAPVIYSTAAGTGGPLIWNKPNSGVDAHILAIGHGGLSTAATAAGSLGLTGAAGQNTAPGTTTAIDASGNMLIGGPVSAMGGIYRIGTPTNAGAQFMPVIAVGTGAITAVEVEPAWVEVGGGLIIPPGCWGSVAGNVTLTAGVMAIGLLWAEMPS